MPIRHVILLALITAANACVAQFKPDDLPTTAYIQCLAVDPKNPQRIYAAAMGDGFYVTENGGERWRPMALHIHGKSAQVIEIDPRDSNRLFAGGERSGVWMSTDEGLHWQSIGLDTVSVCDIALHPQEPNCVMILADDGVYRCRNILFTPWEHVFDYPSFIAKWNTANNSTMVWSYSRFQKIEIDPHHTQTIMIGARWEGGYHRSDDGGDTWQHLDLGGIVRRVDPILFHPTDPNIIMVGTHHQGFFKSYNHGVSWVSQSRGMRPQRRTPYYGAMLVSGLAAAPSNINVLYTGSDNSNWKSVDGGLSWQELGKTLTCPFARSFAVDPTNENIVYAGTNVGVYKSTDGGATWKFNSKGFPTVAVLPTIHLPLHDGMYQFALAADKPLVYRRAFNLQENWLPINWLLPEPVVLLEKGEGADELRLVSLTRTYTSYDGGLRWDDPDPLYIDIRSGSEPQPFSGNLDDPSFWTVEIDLAGNVFCDDRWLGTYYRRPPYIAIYLVSPDYPCDNSKPCWQTTVDHGLHFTIQIPRTALKSEKMQLYCEVHDFQRNTLTGFTAVKPGKTKKATIAVATDNVLAGLQRAKAQLQHSK